MKLKDKIAVVTGGAMGNGLGITEVFLKEGAKVAILDYSDELSNTVTKLTNEGFDVTGYQADIRDMRKVSEILKQIYQKYGNIDILVNNAGVCRLETFMQMNDELRDFHFDINIKGTWNVTKATVPYMKQGSIINLSSVTGPMVADSGEVAYATTKAALIGFTKAIALETAQYNITANLINPGWVKTDMGIDSIEESDFPIELIPQKRFVETYEIAKLILYLISNDAKGITGQSINLCAGLTCGI